MELWVSDVCQRTLSFVQIINNKEMVCGYLQPEEKPTQKSQAIWIVIALETFWNESGRRAADYIKKEKPRLGKYNRATKTP